MTSAHLAGLLPPLRLGLVIHSSVSDVFFYALKKIKTVCIQFF